jgi:hypothetical protein
MWIEVDKHLAVLAAGGQWIAWLLEVDAYWTASNSRSLTEPTLPRYGSGESFDSDPSRCTPVDKQPIRNPTIRTEMRSSAHKVDLSAQTPCAPTRGPVLAGRECGSWR